MCLVLVTLVIIIVAIADLSVGAVSFYSFLTFCHMAGINNGSTYASPGVKENSNPVEVIILKSPLEEHHLTVKRSSSPLKSSSSSASCCRICHDSEHIENLISPCECAGTVALVHVSCMEKWLSSSHTDQCDLCKFKFSTQRVSPTFWQWFLSSLHLPGRNGFLGDLFCLLILTPACILTVYLCTTGAIVYMNEGAWVIGGFVFLISLLLLSYTIWVYITARFYWQTFRRWQKINEKVRLKNNYAPRYPQQTRVSFQKTESEPEVGQ